MSFPQDTFVDAGDEFGYDAALKPFDAQREIDSLKAEVARLAALLERVANAATNTAQRQVEMRADLLKAGAFEQKSSILMPGLN